MKFCAVLLFMKLILIPEFSADVLHQTTILDHLNSFGLVFKFRVLNDTLKNIDNIFGKNMKEGKIQWRIPDSEAFPCDVSDARSLVAPISVDKIRPGDIDVIACMGDSLAAGNGAISTEVGHIINEFRSVSFCGGGRANWRKFLTLPNILKVFNPKLYGYSIADGSTLHSHSRLNIAEPMLWSRDLLYQVNTLINRLKNDPNVDMKNHWKMLTIFVGNNDFCTDICHHNRVEDFLHNLENNLLVSLRMLRDNVPRVIVNVLPVINANILTDFKNAPNHCLTIYKIVCHCFFKPRFKENELNLYLKISKEWEYRQEEITKRKEFRTEDFAVIFQPFFANASIPINKRGNVDSRVLSSDCFHFSQLGHAIAANALWNNVMQSERLKQDTMYPLFYQFECPTMERPFIAT